MTKIQTKTPAKLNLHLKVLGRRPDGYHNLVSVMAPINLYDELELEPSDSRETRLFWEGIPVPMDQNNLVFRAAKVFFKEINRAEGAVIKVKKNIPVAAGMGGGSSDAAAVLLTLNDLFSKPLAVRDLNRLALSLGADVPFFLKPRPCLVKGIGEILQPIENWPESHFVIVHPPLEVSTAWVYANLNLRLTEDEDEYIKKSFKQGFFPLADILKNDLEAVTVARFPVIESMKQALLGAGAEGALMTGSGPTVFGLFSSLSKAQKAGRQICPLNLGDVFVTSGRDNPGD